MTAREEIEREYKVVNGIIESPGKFEGEPVYAPYFWGLYLNGMADYDESPGGALAGEVSGFDLTDEDRERFPELEGFERVELWTDDQGFVWTRKSREKRDQTTRLW